MKISQDIRGFAEAGMQDMSAAMQDMSAAFRESGSEIYVPEVSSASGL